MRKSFSERYGYTPAKAIQFDCMDDALKNRLWSVLQCKIEEEEHAKLHSPAPAISFGGQSGFGRLSMLSTTLGGKVWTDFFTKPIDTYNSSGFGGGFQAQREKDLRALFYDLEWNRVYDLLEFVGGTLNSDIFVRECNQILEGECSAYRFVGSAIGPITNREEIKEIEQAMLNRDKGGAAVHIESASQMLFDRENPDYRNSIKESISAVESVVARITGQKKPVLSEGLRALDARGIKIHPALREGLEKIYGYTSDQDGIRHALKDQQDVPFEDAKFMLVACSALVNYLRAKAGNAGLDLDGPVCTDPPKVAP